MTWTAAKSPGFKRRRVGLATVGQQGQYRSCEILGVLENTSREEIIDPKESMGGLIQRFLNGEFP